MGKMILIMNLSKIRILPSAGEGFPFSVVLFSRLYVVEFWWFPPPPPRCPRCIDYWTDALTHNVTLCLNTCSTDQSLITSNTRLESSKTANQPISKAKLGKVNLFALIQAICGHFWKVDEVFEYMCLSPLILPPSPSIADFSISSAPNFATKTKWNGGWQ